MVDCLLVLTPRALQILIIQLSSLCLRISFITTVMSAVQDFSFSIEPGFCTNCGTILPILGDSGPVKCFMCKTEFGPEAFGDMTTHYTIFFNPLDAYKKDKKKKQSSEENSNESAGPVVERRCPKCDNDKMSYATLQLRSADEGQTVFYTCTKCRYKESENS